MEKNVKRQFICWGIFFFVILFIYAPIVALLTYGKPHHWYTSAIGFIVGILVMASIQIVVDLYWTWFDNFFKKETFVNFYNSIINWFKT